MRPQPRVAETQSAGENARQSLERRLAHLKPYSDDPKRDRNGLRIHAPEQAPKA